MSKVPLPGSPVRGSKTGKPVMALMDLLGRSWSLGVIWQLSSGPLNFRGLQERCEGVSPTALNTRLKELRKCQLVEHGSQGYQLTTLGRELFNILEPLGAWSHKWAKEIVDER